MEKKREARTERERKKNNTKRTYEDFKTDQKIKQLHFWIKIFYE